MLSRYMRIPSVWAHAQRRDISLATAFSRMAAQVDVKETESSMNFENARPFETVPGPSAFEFIRAVLPGGFLYKKNFYELTFLLNERYGPLLKLPGMFGKPETYIDLNPDDYSIIFRHEGQWPVRRSFETLTYHRQVHRREFFQGIEGIIATSGEKWAQVRTAINPILMQPKNAQLYLNIMLEVNNEFIARVREIRDPKTLEMPDSFEEEINRLALESVSAVALNTQLGLIRKNRDTREAKTMITSLKQFFDLSYDLEIMPSIWKIVKTPKFHKMMATLDTLTDICNKYINEAMARIEHDADGKFTSEVGKEKSVLEKLLRVDKRIAVVMALDMMMAGVDTTSTTMAGILLGIAKNPDKQEKLLQEVKTVLPQKDSVLTIENMKSMPYLRACIKEGMRMYPIIPGTMRKLPVDLVLSGYHMRKGADVAMASNMLLLSDKFVPRAKEFLPERWLRNDEAKNALTGELSNPFLFLPFGYGPRSCAGKRIVQMELEITISRLVRNFNIAFNYPVENAFKAKFINVPNIPLKFKFEDRKD